MTTTYMAAGLGQGSAPTSCVARFVKRCWIAFQERRERARLKATLYGMPDRELKDIGITRSEIEYVALNFPG